LRMASSAKGMRELVTSNFIGGRRYQACPDA
jgi:hypothetical protein